MADPTIHEVCVVGAGISGLNALVVAAGHLPRNAPAVVVDVRPRPGGMWVDTYDYVRLHQPHPIFTAGNIKWQLDAPPSHLASRTEVLDHLRHCLDVAGRKLTLDERFGWAYTGHTEADGLVEVRLQGPDSTEHTVITRRLVKAFGHQVQPNPPLSTTSSRVRSITPETLDLDAVRRGDEPVWIVGGGKTAMDAAHRILTEAPGREVHLLAGPGTIFARRDTFFPTGARRWWGGTPINTMVRQVSDRYDGTNEVAVSDWFRSTYGTGPVADAVNYLSAYLSEAENRVITDGLRTAERTYFADAVDRDDGDVDVVDRDGRSRQTAPGSWILNCTGSLLREVHPYEPYTSATGNVLSIQMRSSTFGGFTAFAGYYMTHLMFHGRLHDLPLYELDLAQLQREAPSVVIYASMVLTMHNLSLLVDTLPKRVIMQCGLDFNLWYPVPRQVAGVARFLATHHRKRRHDQRTLDTIATRFGVRSGPLTHAATGA
ncbi:hypothetical protein BJ993_002487 [Nocardioides aromaticivorans]|uniref:Uncharacterized protein n=1 Tax=Nocardioides aromaticivorans TaxID=200618 RepID=A0A7Z0CP22_9ACTN|nr:potassium transporter [Nocardioides aromaticivorans]NYI45407.1 hypothetical protein [Nocardioides aromaticivorans]